MGLKVANQEEKNRFCALKFLLTLFFERQQNICSCEIPFCFSSLRNDRIPFSPAESETPQQKDSCKQE